MRILRVQAERLVPLLEKNYAIYWQPHKQAGRSTLVIPPCSCWIWFEFMIKVCGFSFFEK